MTMGQRILAARQAAGLSQRELAGEEITRNMLSCLERDTANPSVATLRYLSARLGKRVSWFLGEDASEGIRALESGDWRRCREQMTAEERKWLEPLVLLREAEQAIDDGRIPYAAGLLEHLDGSPSPLWCSSLERHAALLRCRCGIFARIPEDDALLLKAEQAIDDGRLADAERYLSAHDRRDARWEYLMGECTFRSGDYPNARAHYHRCEDTLDVRARLEICCREMGDYQMAYFYAKNA